MDTIPIKWISGVLVVLCTKYFLSARYFQVMMSLIKLIKFIKLLERLLKKFLIILESMQLIWRLIFQHRKEVASQN
jgi:hypothetical protein|tara:strand:+ start:75 stop:302 length:228 start_codon:yes stop_codon:yes gene_type:complete